MILRRERCTNKGRVLLWPSCDEQRGRRAVKVGGGPGSEAKNDRLGEPRDERKEEGKEELKTD